MTFINNITLQSLLDSGNSSTTPASAGVTSVGSTFELWYEDN